MPCQVCWIWAFNCSKSSNNFDERERERGKDGGEGGREGQWEEGKEEERDWEREREIILSACNLASSQEQANNSTDSCKTPAKTEALKLLKHNPYFYHISLYSHTYIYVKA